MSPALAGKFLTTELSGKSLRLKSLGGNKNLENEHLMDKQQGPTV